MKKLVFLLLWVTTTGYAQSPMFVEFFVNKDIVNYDEIVQKARSYNAVFVMTHYRSTDTLTCSSSVARMMDKNCSTIPTGYVHGRLLPESLNVKWDSLNQLYGKYETEISCLQGRLQEYNFSNDVLFVTVNMKPAIPGSKLCLLITEDFPVKYKSVLRTYKQIIYTGEPVVFDIVWQRNWNPTQCKIIALVETADRTTVLGVREITVLQSLYTAGIEHMTPQVITLYPNPVTDLLKIEGNIQNLPIYVHTISGQIIRVSTTNSIDCTNIPQGMYIATIGSRKYKFIKQ